MRAGVRAGVGAGVAAGVGTGVAAGVAVGSAMIRSTVVGRLNISLIVLLLTVVRRSMVGDSLLYGCSVGRNFVAIVVLSNLGGLGANDDKRSNSS